MKLFNRWDISKVEVNDIGLRDYINIKPIIIPKTGGRNVKTRFWKSKNSIIERLINKVMVPGHKGKKHFLTSGHCTGKGIRAYKLVENSLGIIEKKLNKNPIEIFVKAVENAAPREELTTIEYGGARYPQSVDCAPQRRIDLALKFIVQGAFSKSFNKKQKFVDTLSTEIIEAYNNSNKSNAISKKLELERQADSSR